MDAPAATRAAEAHTNRIDGQALDPPQHGTDWFGIGPALRNPIAPNHDFVFNKIDWSPAF